MKPDLLVGRDSVEHRARPRGASPYHGIVAALK